MTEAARNASLTATRASFNSGGAAIDSLRPATTVAFSRWLTNVIDHLNRGSFNRPGVRIPGFTTTDDVAKADAYANRIGLTRADLISEKDSSQYALGPDINIDEVEDALVHVVDPAQYDVKVSILVGSDRGTRHLRRGLQL